MVLSVACAAVLTGGCAPKASDTPAPRASATPHPSASPTPLPIAAAVTGLHTTLFDRQGQIVAQVSAKGAATGTKNAQGSLRPEGLGLLQSGEAVLYQQGKPTAIMNADTMEADRQTKTVVGTGNVRVRSLQNNAQNNAPAIRADTMVWRHDDNRLRGKGHVLVTNGPDMDIPGDGFEADTLLRTFRLWNGAEPKATADGNLLAPFSTLAKSPMNQLQKQKSGRVGNVLAVCAALSASALTAFSAARAEKPKAAAPKVRAPQAAASAPAAHYGPFDISNIGQMQSSQSKGTGKITVRLEGPKLSAKSTRYNLAAPHITMLLTKSAESGKPGRLRAQTATATGGAIVTFRNPDLDETTTVTCDKAVYAATNAAKELGRLTMTGSVRSVTRGPAYGDVPLVQTWTSFYVDFADEDTINTGGENGSVVRAVREPAPRKKTGSAQQ